MRYFINKRPWLVLGVTAALAFVLGVGAGSPTAETPVGESTALEGELAAAQEVNAELQDKVDSLEIDLDEASAEAAGVPESCLTAIKEARSFADVAVESTTITQGYIALISRAFEAGVRNDTAEAQAVIDKMKNLTQQTQVLTALVDVNGFRKAAGNCEAAA